LIQAIQQVSQSGLFCPFAERKRLTPSRIAAMSTLYCDLHMHSTASDGTDAPEDLPRLCLDAGLSAFALTDHDTTAGLAACAAQAKQLKIDFVPGIELSANPDIHETGQPVGSLHLLGHFIDPESPRLIEISQRLLKARAQRNPLIIEKLNTLGVRITYDEVLALAAPDESAQTLEARDHVVVGRPHIGQVLVNKGYVKSVHEAFARYIGSRAPAYARKDLLSAAEAIEAVHEAGGLVTLAHPVQMHDQGQDELEHTLARLVELGLDGIETRHSDHTPTDVEHFTRLAERFNLLVSGGSDYHGSRKSIRLNGQRVPREVYERMCEQVE